ncbi:MAG: MFS transporter [Hyphomicrobiaceae bacterium]|nr:MFS transporter [Hyphomicrobiaceae bacterium]
MTAPTALPDNTFSLTSDKNFFGVWQSRLSSGLAFHMLSVAVGWQLYELTNNPHDLGLVGLVQFVPMFVASPIAGYVADNFDRRRVAAICQVLAALAALALAFGAALGWLDRLQIFALMGLIGAIRAFEFPTMFALVPLLVTRDALPRAVSLYASANQSSIVLGPAVGGILTMAGPKVAYGTAALLFALAALITARLKTAPQEIRRQAPSIQALLAGAQFIKRSPDLLGALSLDLIAVLVGAVVALMPIFARDILHVGPWGLGILRASPAIGALAMSLYIARRPLGRYSGKKMFGGVALYGLATLVFGLSTSFVLSVLALTIMGAADMISVVVRQSLVQLRTPDDMRGRVSAVNSMFISGSNQLGDYRAGAVAAAFGAIPAVLLGGSAAILTAGLWTVLFPTLRRLDRLEDAPEKSAG